MAELQKTYSEAVLRAKRFLVSTLIILVVLVLVVEQELREYRKKDQRLGRDIESAAKNLEVAKRALHKTHSEIREFLKKPEVPQVQGS